MIASYMHKNDSLTNSRTKLNSLSNFKSQRKNAQGGLLYIPPLLNNRAVKLLTIYSTLHIPLCNIFIKKEKYHKLQLCGPVSNHY